MSGRNNQMLGRWGEELAAQYLKNQGYRLIESGWRCRYGEVDLIVADQNFLCFVEVKLRKNDAFGRAAEYVDWRKQQRLRTTAQLYLVEHQTQRQPRFDVIEIYAPHGMATVSPELIHLENAF